MINLLGIFKKITLAPGFYGFLSADYIGKQIGLGSKSWLDFWRKILYGDIICSMRLQKLRNAV